MLDLSLPIEARPGPMVLANEDLRRRHDILEMSAFQLQSNVHTLNARTAVIWRTQQQQQQQLCWEARMICPEATWMEMSHDRSL